MLNEVTRRFSLGVVILVGLTVRLVALFVQMELVTLPQGGADAIVFERAAWGLSEFGRGHFGEYQFSGAAFVEYLGSLVYDVTGRQPWVLGLIMVALGTAIIPVSYYAALDLWGDARRAKMVAWAVAIFPQLVLHSALFLREIPVSFCIAMAAWAGVRLLKRNEPIYAIWFALWVIIGTLFHSGVIFAIPALVVGILVARPRGSRGRFKTYLVNGAAAIVLLGAIYAVNDAGYGLSKFGGSLEEAWDTFEVQEQRDTRGGAAYPEWLRVRGGLDDAWKMPIRFVALLFSPVIPFLVRSPGHLLGSFDAMLYILLFLGLVRNWRTIKQDRTVVILLVVLLALFFVYAMGVTNFGTAIRHRAKMAPLLLLLAAGLPLLKVRFASRSLQARRTMRSRNASDMKQGLAT